PPRSTTPPWASRCDRCGRRGGGRCVPAPSSRRPRPGSTAEPADRDRAPGARDMVRAMENFPTALGLAAAIRAKELSPSEALEEALRRVDRLDPALNALCWRDDADARARARAADDAVVAGG